MKRKIVSFYIIFLLLPLKLIWAQGTDSENLARVAIIPFENRTGSENYSYLSESLSEAVNKSMQKNFNYRNIPSGEIKKQIFEKQQDIIRKDGSLKLNNDRRKDEEWNGIVKEISRQENLNSDVIIFGSYTHDNEKNEIIINIHIYIASSDSIRSLDPVRNPVDSTIFKVTEKVGQNIVDQIDQMLKEASKREKKDASPVSEEKKDDGKRAITREAVKNTGFAWAGKKFSIGYFFGYGLILGDGKSYTNFPSFFYMRLMPVPIIHLSLTTRIDSSVSKAGNFDFFRLSVSPMVGYAFNVSDWHFYIEGGPSVLVGASPFGDLAMLGFETSSGFDFLVLTYYSIGLKLNNQYLYDFRHGKGILGMDLLICSTLVF